MTQALALHCAGSGSIPGQSTRNSWWAKWHSKCFDFPLPASFHQCSIRIYSSINEVYNLSYLQRRFVRDKTPSHWVIFSRFEAAQRSHHQGGKCTRRNFVVSNLQETDHKVTRSHIPQERKHHLRRCEELNSRNWERHYIMPIRRILLQHHLWQFTMCSWLNQLQRNSCNSSYDCTIRTVLCPFAWAVCVCTVILIRGFPTVLTANVLLLRTDIMSGNLCQDGWYRSSTAELVTITTLAPRPTWDANTLNHPKFTSSHKTGSPVFRTCNETYKLNWAISSFWAGIDKLRPARNSAHPKVLQNKHNSLWLIIQYTMKAVEE